MPDNPCFYVTLEDRQMHLNLGKCRVHLTPMLKPCGFYGVLKGAVENVSDFLPLNVLPCHMP